MGLFSNLFSSKKAGNAHESIINSGVPKPSLVLVWGAGFEPDNDDTASAIVELSKHYNRQFPSSLFVNIPIHPKEISKDGALDILKQDIAQIRNMYPGAFFAEYINIDQHNDMNIAIVAVWEGDLTAEAKRYIKRPKAATKRSGEKRIKSKRHELNNVWWILPKGSRKEGPFSLKELHSVYRKTDKKSGLKVRKGSSDKWYSWVNAGDVYPELVNDI